ncbi:MAG: MFS transporter [Thermoprotei archaeon]|nr:MAG: MFS transporter [Thermoprotei archaeon]
MRLSRHDVSDVIRGYVELTRPHNLVASALTTLIGCLTILTILRTQIIIHNDIIALFMLAIFTVVFIAAGGYVINDYFDADIDAINKPYRPIPSGRVSRKSALTYSIVLFIVGLILALKIGFLTFLYALFNALLLVIYSYKVKEYGLIGNVVISYLGAASIIFGALSICEYLNRLHLIINSLIPSLYAFLLLLGREIIKTIEDVEADKLRGVRSIPLIHGVKVAYMVSIIPLIIVILLSPLPFLLFKYTFIYLGIALVTDVLLVYAILKIIRCLRVVNSMPMRAHTKVASKLRAELKVCVFVGIMAFLIDLLVRLLI